MGGSHDAARISSLAAMVSKPSTMSFFILGSVDICIIQSICQTSRLFPERWSKVLEFLRSQSGLYVGQEADCKRFVEAIIWMSRSGAPWRMLPAEYGNWNSVYKRFARWCDRGVWKGMHQHFVHDADMEHLIIDSTIVRAHHSAAGAPKKRVGRHLRPLVGAEEGSLQRSTWPSMASAIP